MCYLDVIGPGPWLLMDGTTLSFYTGLLLFCFAAIIITIVTLLVVLWIRSGDDTKQYEQDSGLENCETEEM